MLTTTINQIIVRQGVIVTAQWQEFVSKVFRSDNWICERFFFKEATVHPMLIVKVVYKKCFIIHDRSVSRTTICRIPRISRSEMTGRSKRELLGGAL